MEEQIQEIIEYYTAGSGAVSQEDLVSMLREIQDAERMHSCICTETDCRGGKCERNISGSADQTLSESESRKLPS